MSLTIKRTARLLLALTLLPAVVMGKVSVQALLIHDHHGHDLHAHSLALDDVNNWRNSAQHGHDDHEHDGLPEETPDGDGGTVVLIPELPDALLRMRVLSADNVTAARSARSPLLVVASTEPAASAPYLDTSPWTAAPDLRAGGSRVADILLANHALLL